MSGALDAPLLRDSNGRETLVVPNPPADTGEVRVGDRLRLPAPVDAAPR